MAKTVKTKKTESKKVKKEKTGAQAEQERRMKAYHQMIMNNQYKKDHYERVTLLVKKGEKQKLMEAAKAANMSLSAYILSFVPKTEEEQAG